VTLEGIAVPGEAIEYMKEREREKGACFFDEVHFLGLNTLFVSTRYLLSILLVFIP